MNWIGETVASGVEGHFGLGEGGEGYCGGCHGVCSFEGSRRFKGVGAIVH